MITSLKRKVLSSPGLYKAGVAIANMGYFFANRKKVLGPGNRVQVAASVYKKGLKLKISGKNNSITINDGCRLSDTQINICGNNNSIVLGNEVMVYESAAFYIEGSNAAITVGPRTTVGSAKFFIGEGNTSITIGEDCMLSRDTAMNTSDFHSILSVEDNVRINPPKSIVVKNHVWVGNGAYIAKGAIVGNNCVIASRAYIGGKEYDDNSLLGGLPAKTIKSGITWSREKLPY